MREMAEMLRRGARMLGTHCPECGAPLFQLKTGETFCPRERREVKIVGEGEDPEAIKQGATLEKTLQAKLLLLQRRLEASTDPAEIRELTQTITAVLDALTRLTPERKTP